jgi:hypothetical protein
MQGTRQTLVTSPLERFLAILGAIVCLTITILFWWDASAYQPMWPLPGLYFVEMVALSTIGALFFIRSHPRDKYIPWGAAGAIGAFSILAALSVGVFYVPVALIFTIISITSDLRNQQPMTAHLGIFFIAGLAQAALMVAAIGWLHPGG